MPMSQFPSARLSVLVLAVSQALLYSNMLQADDDRVVVVDGEQVSVKDREITSTGAKKPAISASGKSKVDLSDMIVTTSGFMADGVKVYGGSELKSTGGLSIITSGLLSAGLAVFDRSKADVERLHVETQGSFGVFAGLSTINIGSGSISTEGQDNSGIWSYGGNVTGSNLVIRTQGLNAHGIEVTAPDKGLPGFQDNSTVDLLGTNITTLGSRANGVYVSGKRALAKLTDSSVETHGQEAAGVQVDHGGRVELNNTHVKANGAGSVGALLSGGNLAVSGGSIRSQDAAALHISDKDNKVDISGATIASVNGPAIKVDAGAEAIITVSNGSTLSAGDGKGELLDVQSDSVLDLVIDGSFLHGKLTVPEGGQVKVRLQNGTIFTGQMTDLESLQLDADVSWNITGDSSTDSLVLNGGRVDFSGAAGFHSLEMGELSGSGIFGLKLDLNSRQIDTLDVKGKASGNHKLSIKNTGVEPVASFEPVQVVRTGGGDANFDLLGGRLDLGAFSYRLERRGDNWYLNDLSSIPNPDREVSPATRNVQALFNSAPTVWYGEMSTLRSRMGEVRGSGQGGAWMRTYGNKYDVASAGGLGYQQRQSGYSLGSDVALTSADSLLLVGVLAGYSKSGLTQARGSSGTVESFYAGTYGSWMHDDGYYVDAVLKLNQFRNRADVVMSDFSKAKGKYNNYGLGASLETGRKIQLTERMYAEPFTHISAVAVQGQSYGLDSGLQVRTATARSVLGKVGVTLEHRNQVLSPYLKVALAQEFARDNEVRVNGHRFKNDLHGSRAELGAGVALSLGKNMKMHADFDYMEGQGIKQPWGANIGLRYAFD